MPTSLIFDAMTKNAGNNMVQNALNSLQKSNPNAYANLMSILQSGNQDEAINKLVSQLNPQQTWQFKSMLKMLGYSDADLKRYNI